MLALLALAPLWATAAHADTQPSEHVVKAEDFLDGVRAEGVDATGWRVEGDVDLGELDRVTHLVRCENCTFVGALSAQDVVFERAVDLSGLRLRGALDFRASSFRDTFLLQSSDQRPSIIEGPTDLRLAAFERQLGLDGTRFERAVDAQALASRDSASFVDTTFTTAVDFSRARFRSANFGEATFIDEARFARAVFEGESSFQQSVFRNVADFRGVTFHGPADFSLAEFVKGATFDRATFRADSSFRFANSRGDLNIVRAYARGDLDLESATFGDDVSLAGLTAAETVRLSDVLIDSENELRFDAVRVDGLLMDPQTAQRIRGRFDRLEALTVLEKTAAEEGDIGLANAARYSMRSLAAQGRPWIMRVLDTVFYRGISGYLVRPLHPAVTLVLVMVAASVIHLLRERRHIQSTKDTWNPGVLTSTIKRSAKRARASLSRDPRLGDTREPPLPGEVGIYRALFGLLLITIGNSSETVREIIDAIRG